MAPPTNASDGDSLDSGWSAYFLQPARCTREAEREEYDTASLTTKQVNKIPGSDDTQTGVGNYDDKL
jgi:hypothetical protein